MNPIKALVAIAPVVAIGALAFVLYNEHAHETGWSLSAPHAAPVKQPILFSHEIHVGKRGISCTYCHQFVDKNAHAGIPSMETCAGCHKTLNVAALPEWEQKEIGKFMVGNAPNMVLKDPLNPVKWNRVYDLPNHAHFPHQVHIYALATKQGKEAETACINCHGNIAKQEVVRQEIDLIRMGTCLSCHDKYGASKDCWSCHY
ncbi:MAG: cytochrome c3 family protein [Candidatus Sericytochromatia bacterium]|nr:cytochrome c3 family protein [Candidatus Tanganyikabacteria bacterium]